MEDTNIEKIIDVSKVKTSKELQKKLMEELEFPYFYGKNWDAITGLVEMPEKIIIKGWAHLITVLPDDAAMMKRMFKRLNDMYPMIKCDVKYK